MLLTHQLLNQSFKVDTMTWLQNSCVTNDYGYIPLVVSTSRSFPHSRLITGFVTRLTRREAGTAYLSGAPEFTSGFSGVRVTRSLVLCVCFVDLCFSLCTFSFGHCVVSSSIYGFWLPLWYLQTLLVQEYIDRRKFPGMKQMNMCTPY